MFWSSTCTQPLPATNRKTVTLAASWGTMKVSEYCVQVVALVAVGNGCGIPKNFSVPSAVVNMATACGWVLVLYQVLQRYMPPFWSVVIGLKNHLASPSV